ncbi:ABC transporter substrate-binding protein [Brooklawnia sp.]|uniref:ABC transporter substrate-binding protein n=1 Tax=Brooklawnia sp. TaxID=2699740 RepID=UPI00311F7CE1
MRRFPALLTVALLATTLTACSGGDPLGTSNGSGSASGETIVIGSQQYYSNEIIAELYAQALEADGYRVDRQYEIGQREVYLPELESGAIDLMPEYSGNLLQYLDSSFTATTSDEVIAALPGALPTGLRALDAAEATDQDSYTVTRATAEQYGLSSIGDLTKLPQPVSVAANSEFASRPYGIPGLQEVYGVEGVLTPIEDSGSALTVKALVDGTVQVADIYTASPAITANDLVSLSDPKSLILPQNVIAIASEKVDDKAAGVINGVTAQLGMTDLITLNQQSVDKQLPASTIASEWLTEKGLI